MGATGGRVPGLGEGDSDSSLSHYPPIFSQISLRNQAGGGVKLRISLGISRSFLYRLIGRCAAWLVASRGGEAGGEWGAQNHKD